MSCSYVKKKVHPLSFVRINIQEFKKKRSFWSLQVPTIFTSRCKTTYKNYYLKLLLQKMVLNATETLGFKQKYICLTFVSHYRWYKTLNNTAERSAVSEISLKPSYLWHGWFWLFNCLYSSFFKRISHIITAGKWNK